MAHKHSIALVVCYFGSLPPYINLVVHSASRNPSIDWFVFCDQPQDFSPPPNVRFIRSSLREVEARIADCCKCKTFIESPISLTRFKPVYGLCFHDLIGKYDFWGHVDLDMIYGNLRTYLPDAILESHARTYCRGHLSVFRNTDEVNRYFMLQAPGAPDYRKILSNEDKTQFDEWPGIWKIFRYHNIPQYHDEVIADIRSPKLKWITRFEAEELPNYPHQVFYWHEGRTFHSYYHREGGLFDREVAYIHFQKRRMPPPAFDPGKTRGFLIGPGGFTPYDRENLHPEEMDELNHASRRPLNEACAIQWSKAKRKIKRICSRWTCCQG